MSSGFLGSGIGPTAIKRRMGLAAPTPVLGAELLTNGGFEAWTSPTNADWWAESIAGSSTITQSADAHTGSAAALMSVDGSASTTRLDAPSNITSPNVWYSFSAWIKANLASKTIYLGRTNYPFVDEFTYTVTTSYAQYLRTGRGRNVATIVMIQAVNSSTQYTIDDVSLIPFTLSSLFSTALYASANCDLSAAVTRTAGTQAGFVARLDSASSPANFIIAYLDGAGNVKVDKCVAGVYTNVINGAVTYGSTKILRLVCSGNNVSAYYDGTQVGSTVTVSDAGIASNTRHGLFSTYASNSFAGYVAA